MAVDGATDFRLIPIPAPQTEATALDYHCAKVDRAHPDFNDPLTALAEIGIRSQCFYARDDGDNAPYFRSFASAPKIARCRLQVAKRLAAVNELLEAYGVELFVLDAHRPIALQRDLWNHFIEQAYRHLEKPSEEGAIAFAGRFCSFPRDSRADDLATWTLHITGAAVDLTLCRRGNDELLEMGGHFDEASEVSATARYENKNLHSARDQEALRNRRLLYWAMIEGGFSNYHAEWWHFDYGNQMWVTSRMRGESAWYGPAEG